MAKKLTKKLKNVELEITFVEPEEYDTAKGGDKRRERVKKAKQVKVSKKTQKTGSSKSKK
ncbi:MAG TPA: hypothetical protein VJZ24_00710 [Thermodesulfovibrionales bacterium]|nr:hypothetical protein [Thermodesulfovibrionales bacterium]